MATILVDYENVCSTDGLKGAEYLNENDTLILFYSQSCEKIRAEYIEAIEISGCAFKTYKLKRSGKNALDFYIASECGYLSQTGETQIIIISKDKGFSAIADFFRVKTELGHIKVITAPNIETGLAELQAPVDAERRNLLRAKAKPLLIASEQARIQEHRAFANRILSIFEETEYKEKAAQILRFIDEHKEHPPKVLYTGSLRTFGRKDGREIYQMLKTVM